MLDFKQQLFRNALKDNAIFASQLSDALRILPDTNQLCDSITAFFYCPREEDTPPVDENVAESINDYRFGQLLLNNYRKFSKPSRHGINYFGLPFQNNNGDLSNIFLLGDNGSGKSSLFNSMEFLFTGAIGEASYRGIKNLDWYIGRTIGENPEIKVITTKETFAFSNPQSFQQKTGIDVGRFFFSENSIYELSKHMAHGEVGEMFDWTPFFCYALGLSDIMNFVQGKGMYQEIVDKLNLLDSLISDDLDKHKKEIESLIRDSSILLTNSAKDELTELENKLNTRLSLFTEDENLLDTIAQLIDILPTDIKYVYSINQFKNQLSLFQQSLQGITSEKKEAAEGGKAKKEKSSEQVTIDEASIRESVRQEIISLVNSIEKMLSNNNALPIDEILAKTSIYLKNKKVLESSSPIKKPQLLKSQMEQVRVEVSKGLQSFLKEYIDENFLDLIKETLNPFIEKNLEVLKVQPLTKGVVFPDYGIEMSVDDIPVNKYFNTFRLFCLCVIVAFDFKAMKSGKFIFPLVFDDIFYANDYKNKSHLHSFFDVLTQGAEKFLGDKNKLQIIFFTHDEQFMNTLFSQKDSPFDNAIMARLLDCRYVESWLGDRLDGKSNKNDNARFYKVLKEFKRCKQ